MESFVLTIFGITSNLAQLKLIPALYDMEEEGLLPDGMLIVGNARSPMTPDQIRQYIDQVLHSENHHHPHQIDPEVLKRLLDRIHYVDGNLDDPTFYDRLKQFINDEVAQHQTKDNRIYYQATYPSLYPHIFENLKAAGLNETSHGWVRLMIEKPIGVDLSSAQELNQLLLKYFQEEQIYRLDHYLGKETLQNMLTFRFGNGIFEPLMNSQYIDHIQVTAAEDFGIGKRGGYYDNVGALKDVGQNHLLQMLVFATMDAPAEFSNRAVTDERIKIMESLVANPAKLVLGQYQGYRQEEHVSPESQTDTFFAFRTEINYPRFKGVPIYVRGGKMLKQSVTEVVVVFKQPENRLFGNLDCGETPNVLIYRIQPNEGIALQVLTKKPGVDMKMEPKFMEFCYRGDGAHYLTDPYEKLLLDAMRGDQTFFNDAAEVEAEWKFVDQLAVGSPQLAEYQPGSWGPQEADELIRADGREWLEPSELICRI